MKTSTKDSMGLVYFQKDNTATLAERKLPLKSYEKLKLRLGVKNPISISNLSDSLFDYLEEFNRTDYYYKTKIMEHFVLEQKKLKDIYILSETTIAKIKPDLLIFNDTTKAFKIAVDGVSFEKVDKELKKYQEISKNSCVVVPYERIGEATDHYKDTVFGVYSVDIDNNFVCVKEPIEFLDRLNKKKMVDVFNVDEVKFTLLYFRKGIPVSTQYKLYTECVDKIIEVLDEEEIHESMLLALKTRFKYDEKVFMSIPRSLRWNFYHLDLSEARVNIFKNNLIQKI